MKYLLTLAAAAILVFACARPVDDTAYSATAFATINREMPFTQAKLEALQEAERKARDQILLAALQIKLPGPDGHTLETAAIKDPFLRSRVYDTIRTAKITDQTVDEAQSTVTVTLKMDWQTLVNVANSYDPSAL